MNAPKIITYIMAWFGEQTEDINFLPREILFMGERQGRDWPGRAPSNQVDLRPRTIPLAAFFIIKIRYKKLIPRNLKMIF